MTFEPISEARNAGPSSQGKTDQNGNYTLQLLSGNAKEAIAGEHKVSITAYEGDDTAVPSSGSDLKVFRKLLVPAKYNSQSELTFDVPPGGSTAANFPLETPPPSK